MMGDGNVVVKEVKTPSPEGNEVGRHRRFSVSASSSTFIPQASIRFLYLVIRGESRSSTRSSFFRSRSPGSGMPVLTMDDIMLCYDQADHHGIYTGLPIQTIRQIEPQLPINVAKASRCIGP